jgi:hypothetical protein
MKLEELTPGARITGITGEVPVTVVANAWIGGNALRLTYRTEATLTGESKLDERILYRHDEQKPPPPISELRELEGRARDVTNVSHWGCGRVEVPLSNSV